MIVRRVIPARWACVLMTADKFDGYSGEDFQPVDGRRLERGSMLVRTTDSE